MTALNIEVRAFDHPDVVALVEQIQQFYLISYGSRDDDRTPPEQFAPPQGLFLVGYLDERPVACGGWRRLDPATAEIKRMWIAEAVRGRGLARVMLGELEATAAAAGVSRITLNTGYLQTEAMALYESSGYVRTEDRYGHYADFDGAHFFAKTL